MFLMFLFLYSFLSIMAAHNVCRRPAWMLSPPLLFGIKHLTTRAPLQTPLTAGVCGRQLPSVSISWPLLLLNPFSPGCFGGEKTSSLYGLKANTRPTGVILSEALNLRQLCSGLWPLTPLCLRTAENIISLQELTIPLSNYWYNHIQVQTFRLRRGLPSSCSTLPPAVPCWVHSCGGTCLRSWVCCCWYSAWRGDSCCCATPCSSLATRAAPSYVSRSWSSAGDTSKSWQRRTRIHQEGRRGPPWLVMVSI